MPELSSTASSILTLLSNVNDLIVESSDRQNAGDVMRAIKVYARNNNFPISQDKINNFLQILLDSKPYTLASLIKDIAEDVVSTDRKK